MVVKIAISDPAEIIDQRIVEVAAYVNKSRRALVVTGAGISCSGGIPVSNSSYFNRTDINKHRGTHINQKGDTKKKKNKAKF